MLGRTTWFGSSVFELMGQIDISHGYWQVKFGDALFFVLCSETESHYVTQADLELNTSLPLPTECWGHRYGLWDFG